MQIHRLFVPKNEINNKTFTIFDRAVVNKFRQVLRLNTGDKIEIFDGEGKLYEAEIEELHKDKLKGKIIDEKTEIHSISDKPYIILAQALPRAGKADEIIRMNTEIGVSEFIFFESDYSVVKLKDVKPNKLDRWNKITLEATRQSERLFLPIVHEPIKFEDLSIIDADYKLILHSRDVEGKVQSSTFEPKTFHNSTILIIIGPEGGFSPKEIEMAISKEIKVIYLDMPILRTETAGVVVCGSLLI